MASVKLKHLNESFDSLLRRFKRAVDKDDTIKESRKHEFYEKPSSRRKRAHAAAVKRNEKQQSLNALTTKRYF